MKKAINISRGVVFLLPILAALLLVVAAPELAFAQEGSPAQASDSVELETGSLDIEDNAIYVRLIEIINFLSIGVTIVVAISVAVAGFQYTFSRGDPAQTSAAVKRLVQAGTAIFLYVFGWAILNWLIPGGIFN